MGMRCEQPREVRASAQWFTRRNGDGTIRVWQEVASGGGAGFTQVAITK
jgi:hypothetical protein